MSHSPATPDQSTKDLSKHSTKVAVPLIHMHAPTTDAGQASLHEPSPASTYGDTIAGDSSPATPQEGEHHDGTGVINVMLVAAQLDDVTKVSGESSGNAEPSKIYAQSESRATASHSDHIDPYSPSQAGGVGKYRQSNTSASSSPTARRFQTIIESPSWRRGDFVQQYSHRNDDPFLIQGHISQAQEFRPREDRAGLELSGDTAQAVLPPNACVFVANLCQTRTDDQLEYSVTRAFSTFGNVYVKIRRDGNGMPFAFCQYEHVIESERAIQLGRGLIIDGRSVRTERAKVNRQSDLPGSLYLSRVTGGPIFEAEARQTLTQYGAIEKVWYCTQTDKEMFQLPDGIWVMFAFFQDCRDAQAAFRDHPTYRLVQPPLPEDIAKSLKQRSFQSPIARSNQGHHYVSPSTLVRRSTDRCSIFVGNLPPKVTQDELIEMFGACGRIRGVEIVSKPSVNVNGVNVFAFVEFSTEEEALGALKGDNRFLGGVRLRVERKESTEQSPRRTSPMTSVGSPQNRVRADSPIATYYHRALAMGISPIAAAQLFNLRSPQPFATPSMAPPVYAPYSYYPYYQPPYGPYVPQNPVVDGETSVGIHGNPQMHGSSQHMPQPMGQFQYPQASTSYVPYTNYSTAPPYVYPPVNTETTDTTLATTAGETQ